MTWFCAQSPGSNGLLPELVEGPAELARGVLTVLNALRYELDKDAPNPANVRVCLEGMENGLWKIERWRAPREAVVELPDAAREAGAM